MNETSPAADTAATDTPAGGVSQATRAERRRAERRWRGGGWMDYVVTLVVALVIAILVKTFLIQPFFIPSSSMVPTLETNDKILVSKLTPGVFDLHRGDVIVFEDPGTWVEEDPGRAESARYRVTKVLSYIGLAPDPATDHLVKRLIGLPGDHVVCESQGGPLQVNGVTLDEPYINPETPACQAAFDVTVPQDNVWVMGDNRLASADSAYHESQGEPAFVPMHDITGKAEVIMWPISRWDRLDEGAATFADVPDAP